MKTINLRYTCALLLDDKLFFSGADVNGLFQMDIKNFSIDYLTPFYGYPAEYSYMHLSIVPYENKLFFFPLNGKTIHSYELKTGLQQYIEIPMKTEKGVSDRYHGNYVVLRGRKVWLFSREYYRGIYEFDMADYSIKKSKKMSELMLKYNKTTNFIETADMRVFTYNPHNSALIEIDVEKETVQEHVINICDTDIISINYFLGKFWFNVASGDIYEWNMEDQKMKKYIAEGVEWIADKGNPFGQCCLVNGEIYVLPGQSKYIMKLDRESGKITKAVDYPDDFCFSKELEIGAFNNYDVVGDTLWLHPCRGNRLLFYDTKAGLMESREISFDFYKILNENVPFQKGTVWESNLLSLDYLCQAEWKRQRHNDKAKDNLIGKAIYKRVSRLEEEMGNE